MKIKILGESYLYLIHTRDIYTEEQLNKFRECMNAIDWDNDKWIMFPSEYVSKVQVVKR